MSSAWTHSITGGELTGIKLVYLRNLMLKRYIKSAGGLVLGAGDIAKYADAAKKCLRNELKC
jgi:hypothetical protein